MNRAKHVGARGELRGGRAEERRPGRGRARPVVCLLALVFAQAAAAPITLNEAKAQPWDAILVLGGGAPPAPRKQLPFVAARCEAAAEIWAAAASTKPKILTLSAGTAHVPQLLDARGAVIFEATASAAVLVDLGVAVEDVFVETTSYDTISNAFFARTDHSDLAGWRRLLVITSDFHVERTEAIFRWVFGAAPTEHYAISYLGTADRGLSVDEVQARRAREAKSADNVRTRLAPAHPTLKSVREFLVSKHDLYSASGLVARASRSAAPDADDALLASYGGARSPPPPSRSFPFGGAIALIVCSFALGSAATEAVHRRRSHSH